MKTRSILMTLLFLLQMGFVAQAQLFQEGNSSVSEWEVPTYSFKGVPQGDPDGLYTRYQAEVINCHDWLQNTPIDMQIAKRNEAKRFMTLWTTGCDDVHITLHTDFMYVSKVENEMMISYLGGWSKYALLHKDMAEEELEVQSCLAGIEAQLALYKNNEKSFASNKDLKKFIKNISTMKKKNQLEGMVRNWFNQNREKLKAMKIAQ